MFDEGAYNSYLEIDRGIMARNFGIVQAHVGRGVGIIPVLKSNAYGHGTVETARVYVERCSARIIAVSHLVEALAIRRAGMGDVELLVMGGLLPRQMSAAVAEDIQFALFDIESARALDEAARAQGRRARVQIKVETGFNRIGVPPGQPLDALLDELQRLGSIEVVGAFTHYATAETVDEPFVLAQHGRFEQAVGQMQARRLPLRYVHSCNTGAATWFCKGYGTHVRVGCAVMGYASMNDFSNPLGLEEPMSWRAFVTHIHPLPMGQSCGYEHHFVAPCDMTVATVNIGYGDGLYRPLAQGGGPVIVNDTRTRFLAVCMDMSMVDVTGIGCRVGDEVTLIGTSRGGTQLSINELSELSGQPPTYPMVTLGQRITRRYIG